MPEITIKRGCDYPEIYITAEDAERMTGGGGGPQVAEINVVNANGSISRFFISVGINKRNQPVCEVSTNRRDLKSTRKEITAHLSDAIQPDRD